MQGLELRCSLAHAGVSTAPGLHAKNDSWPTRRAMFALINAQSPRIDTTFLLKRNAYPTVRAAGEMRLYKLAWFLHLKTIALQVSETTDRLFVVAGTFGTKKRRTQAEEALRDVCQQVDRDITLSVWDASTSWGLQVADYALWATQRRLVRGTSTEFEQHIRPHLRSLYTPWGQLPLEDMRGPAIP